LQLNGHVSAFRVGFTVRSMAFAAGMLGVGCEVSSPTAPTGPATTTTSVTVRTLARGSEAPLSGVRISVDHQFHGVTNADGTFAVVVDLGRWVRIDASRDEYGSFGAEGEINGPERWTFYLEPVTESPAS
jgi:hypothetical protein